jgi:hypothetical protein
MDPGLALLGLWDRLEIQHRPAICRRGQAQPTRHRLVDFAAQQARPEPPDPLNLQAVDCDLVQAE